MRNEEQFQGCTLLCQHLAEKDTTADSIKIEVVTLSESCRNLSRWEFADELRIPWWILMLSHTDLICRSIWFPRNQERCDNELNRFGLSTQFSLVLPSSGTPTKTTRLLYKTTKLFSTGTVTIGQHLQNLWSSESPRLVSLRSYSEVPHAPRVVLETGQHGK